MSKRIITWYIITMILVVYFINLGLKHYRLSTLRQQVNSNIKQNIPIYYAVNKKDILKLQGKPFYVKKLYQYGDDFEEWCYIKKDCKLVLTFTGNTLIKARKEL